jgi:hypothetical protein
LRNFTEKILPRMVESILVLAAGVSKCLQQTKPDIKQQPGEKLIYLTSM